MTPDYFSDVQCRFFDTTREQVDAWLDRLTDIGEDKAPGNMFDVDFSAVLGRTQRQIGIQAAHRISGRRYTAQAEAWTVFSSASGHALDLLAATDALAHLESMQVEITRTVSGEEITLTYTASGPHSIKVTQATEQEADTDPKET